jgi:hypothetical protein
MQIIKKAERAVKRSCLELPKESKVDKSFKKASDINNIVGKFLKTGVLPQVHRQGVYGDYSEVPTLEEAFEAANQAVELFLSLPSDVRKLMDNDPSKLESWLLDDNNADLAEKHGLLVKKNDVAQNSNSADNNSNADSSNVSNNHGGNANNNENSGGSNV